MKIITIEYPLYQKGNETVCCLCEILLNESNRAQGEETRQVVMPDREYRFKHSGGICSSCLYAEIDRICNNYVRV